jgi:neurofibromin 1
MTKQAKLDFCELLANESLDIVEAFSSQVIIQADRARTQVLCQALSDFFEAQGRSLKLIHWAIQDEVELSKADGSVFRGTSAATLLMNVFFKKVGSEYLRQIISSAVQDICTCNCTFEISPDKCPSEELKANVLKIFSVAQRLLSGIIENIDECPVPIRVSLNVLKREIARKFPSLQGVVVGSFLFLRFFCPAIVSPEELNILATPPSQTARRGLILVSKLLQNLANGLEFGNKEPAMASFNPFISDNKEKVEAFFNILADVSVNLPEAVHTHLKSMNSGFQKTRSHSTSGTADAEINSKKGKKKRGRSKSMEEQRKKNC